MRQLVQWLHRKRRGLTLCLSVVFVILLAISVWSWILTGYTYHASQTTGGKVRLPIVKESIFLKEHPSKSVGEDSSVGKKRLANTARQYSELPKHTTSKTYGNYSERGKQLPTSVNKTPKKGNCSSNRENNWSFDCFTECPKATDLNERYVQERTQLMITLKNQSVHSTYIKTTSLTKVPVFRFGDDLLRIYIERQCHSGYAVPRIVHQVWFGKRNMSFYHYLSFYSAHKHFNPCIILLHSDILPYGLYWELLLTKVPNIVQIETKQPEKVFGVRLSFMEHKSDVVRLLALKVYGGLYMDNDMVILKSLDPLMNFPATLSKKEVAEMVENSMIISVKNSSFIRLWIDSYKKYNPNSWSANSMEIPVDLAKKYPDIVHVERGTMVSPCISPCHVLENVPWTRNYGIHIYTRGLTKKHLRHDFNDIRKLNLTLGSLSRYVLYGTKELCLN